MLVNVTHTYPSFSSYFIHQINGVDVSEADHAEVVGMLTGYERFIRLCVERQINIDQSAQSVTTSASTSVNITSEKSPKLFGLPKPYTGLKLHGNSSYISPSSYMANRPDYMRRREPGQYSRTSVSTNNSNSPTTPNTLENTSGGSLGSYGKLPGMAGILSSGGAKSNISKSGTLPGSRTLPELVTSTESPRTSVNNISSKIVDVVPRENSDKNEYLTSVSNTISRSDGHHTPDTTIKELTSKLPAVPPAGSATETVKRTTYTETTVKRVTTNHTIAKSHVKPVVIEVG